MKALYTPAFFLSVCIAQAQVTITTTDNDTFSPNTVTVQVGETVTFMVMDGHTATQVSEATWLANDDTPLPGGFDFDEGTHTHVPTTAGIIYFVCQPHADEGMKGQINVTSSVGLEENTSATGLHLFPNPASSDITITTTAERGTLTLVDMLGKEVMRTPVNTIQKMDVSMLREGNYTVILRNEEGAEVGKTRFVITR